MSRRTRNLICIWIIFAGLANYIAYGIGYAWLQGDAKNGYIEVHKQPDGTVQRTYFVRGHFLKHGREGKTREVTRAQWIYSYIHSISLWITHAAVLLAMLTLARPHIIATMRNGPIAGRTFVNVFATLIIVIFGAATAWFVLEFVAELSKQ